MTSRVDQESSVLKNSYPGHTTNEKASKRSNPAIPESAQNRWQDKAHEHSDKVNVAVLPHRERIFFQIVHVVERGLRKRLEQQPADMRVEKSLGYVVRIFVVIDMFMVATMLAAPHQRRILERARAENENEKTHGQFCPKSRVREQTMIAERDAEGSGQQQQGERRYLKPVDAEKPEVSRHRGAGEKEGADEERTCRPIDSVCWNWKHCETNE